MLYVIDDYNSKSQTFVRREIDMLLCQEVDVRVFSLHPSRARTNSFEVEAITKRGLIRAAAKLVRRRDGRRLLLEISRLVRRPRNLLGQLFAALVAVHLEDRVGDPRHIHAHFFGRCADVAYFLGRLTGTGFSATGHATEVLAPAEPEMLRRNVSAASGVVGESELIRSKLMSIVMPNGKPSIVVRSGLPRALIEAAAPRPRGDRTSVHILTIARLVPKKGFATILDAARRLTAGGFDYYWEIIGDGPLRPTLQSEIHRARLSSSMDLLGALNNDSALLRLSASDLFVLPCARLPNGETDGLPAAIIEAVALGTPVITTPVGAIPELIRERETGILVPENDGCSVAAAIRDVHADPDLYLRLVEAGKREAQRHYVLETEVSRLCQFFEAIQSS